MLNKQRKKATGQKCDKNANTRSCVNNKMSLLKSHNKVINCCTNIEMYMYKKTNLKSYIDVSVF